MMSPSSKIGRLECTQRSPAASESNEHRFDVFVPSCPTMTALYVGSYPTYQYCTLFPFPPAATGTKPGFAWQFAEWARKHVDYRRGLQ
jgi:hypothetical protein